MSDPVKAHLTKYVCATGAIDEIEVWDNKDGWAAMRGNYMLVKWDRDAFRTRDAAVVDARKRVTKKVVSLKKQIDKLTAMSFA